MTEPGERRLTVGPDEEGQRLDAFLVGQCPDRSRTQIQGDLAADRATVDGRRRAKNFRVRPGQEVRYTPSEPEALTAAAQDIPLTFVHRDEHLVVVDKPAGLVVHPSAGHPDGTLVNALLHHFDGLADGGDPLRPGIVHRLDRDTSGLLVVALTDQAHRSLQAQIQDRRMGRTYQALSWGSWAADEGRLTGDIGRHPRRRQLMAVVERDGRPAATRYRVVEDFGFVQHCEVTLETGRTHQIRVHFAHNHHPIVGDATYGDDRRSKGVHNLDRQAAEKMVRGAGRQMLHAARLRFAHPADGRPCEFTAATPRDLATVLADLRARD